MINETISKEISAAVRELLPEYIDGEVTVQVEEIVKDNDLILHGLVIRNQNENVAPSIYLENYSGLIERGVAINEIAKMVISEYLICMSNVPVNVGFIAQPNFKADQILDKLEVQLVNRKMNKSRLTDAVYGKAGEEFALLVYIVVTEATGDLYRTIFKKQFLENTDLTEEEVIEIALKNTEEKRKPVFTKIIEIFDTDDELVWIPFTDETPVGDKKDLFLLTNTDMHFGATAFYYPGVMERIGKKLNQNYYAIPSSVDEFLIIPEELKFPESALKTMLTDGNDTTIEKAEYLSDSIFKYDIGQGELCRVEVGA